MLHRKAYKYRLYPTRAQAAYLRNTMESCRIAYNFWSKNSTASRGIAERTEAAPVSASPLTKRSHCSGTEAIDPRSLMSLALS